MEKTWKITTKRRSESICPS